MGRVLALDIGTVRIGAAISDPSRIIAQGLGVWKAENDEWLNDFDECLKKFNPSLVVVGLPVRTDGKISSMSEKILAVIENLKSKYPELEFTTWDERFTTVIAQQTLISADVSRKKRKKNVDKIAAVLILENWLEFHS
ncbi:MAG: Holliday junction resolvase RuvX [Synergistaceae bacterium]|nr:Holliday junction resolvase RuvX [Synergistaceae bacterium]MBR0079378.1 Holliday junction resolvase RuvX [Synergistaceae bacterium]MBR0233924.1 Holliday junction resolvase RuvX [Synergistaceae bacterium]MBR0317067.1 Holliday junction resolvase RuvX [Synergistaceae bacterium]